MDDKFLACGGEDKLIHFYEVENFEESFVFDENRDSVWCMAFSPDGNLFVSGGADKILRIFDYKKRSLKN